jgi:DNA-binding CsgD family transcriptional regulator
MSDAKPSINNRGPQNWRALVMDLRDRARHGAIPVDTAPRALDVTVGEISRQVLLGETRLMGARLIVAVVLGEPEGCALQVEAIATGFGLTPRETEVAVLLADRRTEREISDLLGVKPTTVRRHTERIFRKLSLHSRKDVAGKLFADTATG